MLNFDGDFDGHGGGDIMCNLTQSLDRKKKVAPNEVCNTKDNVN